MDRSPGFYVIAFDIAERRSAEQRLAASERRLAAITGNISLMVAHIGKAEQNLFVNTQIGAALGLDVRLRRANKWRTFVSRVQEQQ